MEYKAPSMLETFKQDRIDRLVKLPFAKSVEISFKSIRVRFFRSLITTMSLLLAVSFLSFVNVGTDVADGLLATGDIEVIAKEAIILNP